MKVNCKTLLTGFVTCAVFLIQKCYSQVITLEDKLQNNTPIATTCTLPEGTEAYCIPIRNCLTLLMVLNASAVRARKCGPLGENRTNPHVCCENHYIKLESSLTSTQSTLPTTPLTSTTLLTTTAPLTIPLPSVIPSQQRPSQNSGETDIQSPFQGCGFQEISSRILGGEPSSPKEFPWLARLLRRDDKGEVMFSCTGALITSKVVLTTAHCLISSYLQNIGDLYAVSLGEHETECNTEATECLLNKKTIMISKYFAHPQYNTSSKNHDNDIGLVILRRNVPFSSYITPICLMENAVEATEYHIAGWGKTESDSASGVKLKAVLPSFSWEQCAKKYRSINIELTARQICAGGVAGRDSCQGDSGGPLMVNNNMRWYVAGVVSFGLGCGKQGWPAVYVYVPSYISWIKENIKQNAS